MFLGLLNFLGSSFSSEKSVQDTLLLILLFLGGKSANACLKISLEEGKFFLSSLQEADILEVQKDSSCSLHFLTLLCGIFFHFFFIIGYFEVLVVRVVHARMGGSVCEFCCGWVGALHVGFKGGENAPKNQSNHGSSDVLVTINMF